MRKIFQHRFNTKHAFVFFAILFIIACSESERQGLFTQLNPEKSGIAFSNTITEDDIGMTAGGRTSSAINEFLYMGGGVGAGDFNNNGWQDLFFAGNQVSSRLYINLGIGEDGYVRFEDITESAGVATDVWATGVSIADINNNGFDDIYVCVYGGQNLLFINNGDLTFTEQAEEYGLAIESDATQAVFFDYNRNGRKDLFLTNFWLDGPNPNLIRPKNLSGNSPANDKLYENKGIPDGKNHPIFEDVSLRAGITGNGYGLGVVATDINGNGWPDLYVANDFLYGDELWLNNKDGTFTNVIGKALRYQSYSSMGVDAADINNNQLSDIITLDMAPEENERKKMQYTFMNYNRYQRERSFDYEPSFMRNMLHVNNGIRTMDELKVPFFSEIGQYAGIAETDWSWSVLAADFTNNGWKDIYITNGSGRDYLNADFIEYSTSEEVNEAGQEQRNKMLNQKLRSQGFIKLPNYFYLNNQDYTFTDFREKAGLDTPALSSGAIYVDIDNDGDLDLIVNNINEPASVFINNTISNNSRSAEDTLRPESPKNHYLQIDLTGPDRNLDAFGARVHLYNGGNRQMLEKYPVRGYLSSVDSRLLFGLASSTRVDSLVVFWPDDYTEVFNSIPVDTLLNIRYGDSDDGSNIQRIPPVGIPTFYDVTAERGIHYMHVDVPYNDYIDQPLLPQKYSQLGPFITTGDVNNNGLTDFFVGGGFNSSGVLFTQKEDDTFQYVQFDSTIKYQEDMDTALFDSNGNGHLDLLITYGDTRYDEGSLYYKPRLYLNDGEGNFTLYPDAIPDHVRTIAGTVAIGDYNGNGQPDIFIGGRVSKAYPQPPKSFLLQNENGVFRDVTPDVAPELMRAGMITSAEWADINGNNIPDLVIAGEWMPIRFFKNDETRLTEITDQTGLTDMNGLWRSLAACDINQNEHVDFIAGNLGNNNKYNVSPQTPLKLFAADINQNGFIDPIKFYYRKDASGSRNLYPAVNRDQLLLQVPEYQNRFPTNKDYSTAGFDDMFRGVDLENLIELTLEETGSYYLINRGNGSFDKFPLPAEVQFAPIDAIICEDLDGDGHIDLLLAGNEHQTEVRTGKYDASYGYFLKQDSSNKFKTIPPAESGFIMDGDVKDMIHFTDGNGRKLILTAVNNDSLRVFEINPLPEP